jgi:hypothetical protein
MKRESIFQTWRLLMTKRKSLKGVTGSSKIIKIKLIPSPESLIEFEERKNEVQDIISKMIILATTRGRPRKDEQEDYNNAA